jgi:lipopolysaccharide exporter
MSLGRVATGAAKWTATSTLITTAVQLTQLSILARLLSPEDFGLMAMVVVVIGFGQLFTDMGISNAIIHRQDITESSVKKPI